MKHLRGMIRDRNFAPGNSLILIAGLGPPIVALITLSSLGAIWASAAFRAATGAG